jgi:phosphate-selective porin OprO/OprP
MTASGYGYLSPNTANVKAGNYGLEGIAAYNNFKVQGEWSKTDYQSQHMTDTNSTIDGVMKANVDTWYAEALWLVTGEKYADMYKKGAFGSLKPKSEFNLDSNSGTGAVELGFRVDAFDVSDTYALGNSRFQGAVPNRTNANEYNKCNNTLGANCDGGAKSYTASVRWVWNPNILFKANWTYTKFDDAIGPIDILGAKYALNGQVERTSSNIKAIDSENLLMIRGQYMF